ncbi:hypothetical protein LTR10_007587 [Elasticomyces elasticus]|nr:hypothetical protein LTR10_007587 [Elasticomyces elasticus]KAK4970591.1 hypothetical protein LTR42_007566 [Elasticomyces elasticus]
MVLAVMLFCERGQVKASCIKSHATELCRQQTEIEEDLTHIGGSERKGLHLTQRKPTITRFELFPDRIRLPATCSKHQRARMGRPPPLTLAQVLRQTGAPNNPFTEPSTSTPWKDRIRRGVTRLLKPQHNKKLRHPTSPIVKAVFETTELLEAILLQLPLDGVVGMRTLLLSQRVNRTFRDTIKDSVVLQRALFFEPEPAPMRQQVTGKPNQSSQANLDESVPAISDPTLRINPLLLAEVEDGSRWASWPAASLRVAGRKWSICIASHSSSPDEPFVFHLRTHSRRGCATAMRSALLRDTWPRMLLTQPQTTISTISSCFHKQTTIWIVQYWYRTSSSAEKIRHRIFEGEMAKIGNVMLSFRDDCVMWSTKWPEDQE